MSPPQTRFKQKLKKAKNTAGPLAEQSRSSDLDCGQGDLGSNPGKGVCFFWDAELSGSHIACFHRW